jgi:hypothetical protein
MQHHGITIVLSSTIALGEGVVTSHFLPFVVLRVLASYRPLTSVCRTLPVHASDDCHLCRHQLALPDPRHMYSGPAPFLPPLNRLFSYDDSSGRAPSSFTASRPLALWMWFIAHSFPFIIVLKTRLHLHLSLVLRLQSAIASLH